MTRGRYRPYLLRPASHGAVSAGLPGSAPISSRLARRPASLIAEFNNRDQRVILHENGRTGFTVVVGFLQEATILQLSRRLPHSIFFCAFLALAVDGGRGRTGFPPLSFARLFIERVMDSLQRAVIGPQIEVVVDRALSAAGCRLGRAPCVARLHALRRQEDQR
jgi:hypothetical protein